MSHDIKAGRISVDEIAKGFCDLHAPLNQDEAISASSRCLFCHDAPCITACPTGIDIPNFIRKISTDNLKGAALDILGENIMGGTCARVCPVETLCEKACVKNHMEHKPVEIGRLQRFATDDYFKNRKEKFRRLPLTGKKIAVVGAGPAGLSCGHRLAMLGHEVTVFEAREKSGGLNEYGLAAYKVVDDWVQTEIEFLLSIGGIKIENGKKLGENLKLSDLQKNYSAVFLGLGLNAVRSLELSDENAPGVFDATEFIEKIRQAKDLSKLEVGRRVVVIGGGNTAIDMAVQIKRLGAEEVTLAYRRGPENMKATDYEQDLAKQNGVNLKFWLKPSKINADKSGISSIEFENKSKAIIKIECDQLFKAIGQTFDSPQLPVEMKNGKISVNESRETSTKGVFAGGDCIDRGEDLTVQAVQDGKIAAHGIHKMLTGKDIPTQGFFKYVERFYGQS